MNKNDLIKHLKKEIQDIYTKINEFENSDQIHIIDKKNAEIIEPDK